MVFMVVYSMNNSLKPVGGSRFELIKKAARRAHELKSGAPSLFPKSAKGHKATVVALIELSEEAEKLYSREEGTEVQS